LEKVLKLAMDIGEQMLLCGAEIHRVEDSINRICMAKGAYRTDAFIITSCMIVTVYDSDGKSFSQTRRIKNSGTDIEKLHKLNNLSRKICSSSMSYEEITAEFEKINQRKGYSFIVNLISYMLIAGAFTLFFGGNPIEAIVSAIIGGINNLTVLLSEKLKLNKIFSKFICSAVVTFLAFLAMFIGVIGSVDTVIIGNIMTLIPGVGLTNAVRDLFIGDSISGILRSVEACLNALAIAAGYIAISFIAGGIAI